MMIRIVSKGCPGKYFDEDLRCSELRLEVGVKKEGRYNHACKLTGLANQAVSRNLQRHDAVEEFMLINDSCTVAREVPVWYWDKRLGGVAGHIDLVQVRFGNIWILDYKPGAGAIARRSKLEREVITQLYLYALALSFRTGIPLSEFRCAWFDECVYYCFDPSKVKKTKA
jgi:hypothetical protein